MEQNITSWRLDWLTRPDSDGLQFDRGWANMSSTPIPMPSDWGSGVMELHHLGQGMDISRIRLSCSPAVSGRQLPLATIRGTVPDPMFGVYAVRVGSGRVKENRVERDFTIGGNCCLFQHADFLDFEPRLDASAKFESTTITMGLPVLNTLLGEETVCRMLEKLRLLACPSAASHLLPQGVCRILHETLPGSQSDPMRVLFSQARTLEFLCAVSTFLVVGTPDVRRRANHRAIVDQLRTELMTQEGKIPSLTDLAARYGLSTRALNEEFRRYFGSSIYSFISDYRLVEARAALVQTDVPMKALAQRLGYSHVNHFISAFRKRFGESPGRVRRTGRAA